MSISPKRFYFAISLIVFCLFQHNLQAQKFLVGAKVGGALATLENFDFDNADGFDATSFHGGGMAMARWKSIGLQGEALFDYSQFEGDVLGISTKFTYMRITVPIIGKFYFAQGANFQIGPRVGFLISAESEDEDGFVFDRANTTESTDIGLQVGFGYDLPLGVSVNARYNVGITDFPGPDQNLAGIEVSIGYYFYEIGGLVSGIPTPKRKKWKGR